jgi:hypothetical protein
MGEAREKQQEPFAFINKVNTLYQITPKFPHTGREREGLISNTTQIGQ